MSKVISSILIGCVVWCTLCITNIDYVITKEYKTQYSNAVIIPPTLELIPQEELK